MEYLFDIFDEKVLIEDIITIHRNGNLYLIDILEETGLEWEEVAERYIKSVEIAMVNAYIEMEETDTLVSDSPGLRVSPMSRSQMHLKFCAVHIHVAHHYWTNLFDIIILKIIPCL